MHVLLLSCNTGEGHNTCAKAIAEVFLSNGDGCAIQDALGFISERASRLISRGDLFVYRRTPGLFRLGYGLAERHSALFHDDSLCSRFFAKGAGALYREIMEQGYDAVICTHPFAALVLREVLRRYPLHIPTAFVATDYTCCPGAGDADLDLYFIPDKALAKAFAKHGIAADRIIPSGIPIRQMFYQKAPSAATRQASCHAPECCHLVLMCGSLGCGPIRALTKLLAQDLNQNFKLTVICGSNERRRRQLVRRFGHLENLRILGYVEDMAAMLDSADIFITKPGGISVTEAAAKDVPMVFIHAVDGCESYNRRFFVELGGAEAGSCPREAAALCRSLLQDPAGRIKMSRRLSARSKENAAITICAAMHRCHESRLREGRIT